MWILKQKIYIFLESDGHAEYKKYILFLNMRKHEKSLKSMQILQISVCHFEFLMIYDFLQKVYVKDLW